VRLLGFFLLGVLIGRWWALVVTCADGVIPAIPVSLGLLPGYLSTWGEALWWALALAVWLARTGPGCARPRGPPPAPKPVQPMRRRTERGSCP
jgi:hypothetical protein